MKEQPENLLLDKNDDLKITDFGLSTLAIDKNSVLTTTCGTPQYVAPEIVLGHGYSGFKADIWSCGVILYVMVSGRLPFEDQVPFFLLFFASFIEIFSFFFPKNLQMNRLETEFCEIFDFFFQKKAT